MSGKWRPNWQCMFYSPMALTLAKLWFHIRSRWEFNDNNSKLLSVTELKIIQSLTNLLTNEE